MKDREKLLTVCQELEAAFEEIATWYINEQPVRFKTKRDIVSFIGVIFGDLHEYFNDRQQESKGEMKNAGNSDD